MKIGLLTSGGDCQGLNATLRGVAKAAYNIWGQDTEIYGIAEGYKGLIHGDYRLMGPEEFSGILSLGGTILGTSRQPFKEMRPTADNPVDKLPLMVETYKKMGLDCLVILGGNGTHKTAHLLSREGLHVVTLPKTIDNDLYGTEVTFGFQSAVDIASDVVDRIHTTASAHRRIFVIELMGNKAGWLTLHAGIAGSADVILLPEIPYDPAKVVEAIRGWQSQGREYAVIAVAEGAVTVEESAMKRRECLDIRAQKGYPSVGYMVADQVAAATGSETRVVVPGHYQRAGSPCAYDKVLSTALGATAAEFIRQRRFGCMVGVAGGELVSVPLEEVAGRKKLVTEEHPLVQTARRLGVCLGD